jgi:hypothetical protein
MIMLIGAWPLIQGLAALVQTHTLVAAPYQTNQTGVVADAWVRVILGAVIAASGYCLLSGSAHGRGVGAGLAAVSALAALLYLPSSPWWALLTIGLDLFVVCALIIAPPTDRAR